MSTIYVLPNLLSENVNALSIEAMERMKELRVFAVENVKMARRSLRALGIKTDFDACRFYCIHHKTDSVELDKVYHELLEEASQGNDIGILSDAGMAGVADPGSSFVSLAHKNRLLVRPIAGPSSILLALCASGFNGQKFTFHGYLPIEKKHREATLKEWEQEVRRSKTTQIFMETPYRNKQLLDTIVNCLHTETLLCIAINITSEREKIISQPIKYWANSKVDIQKQPAIFLLGE